MTPIKPLSETTDTVTISRADFDVLLILNATLAGMNPIAAWRTRRGMKQNALAEQAGVSQSLLNEMEAGKKSGSIHTLRKLATALDTTVDSLMPLERTE